MTTNGAQSNSCNTQGELEKLNITSTLLWEVASVNFTFRKHGQYKPGVNNTSVEHQLRSLC